MNSILKHNPVPKTIGVGLHLLLPLACALLLWTCQSPQQNQKNNVLLIVVDDLGWSDLGFMGSTYYETPNLDALSQNSVSFTNAYASASVCSPSRAALMTGKHPVSVDITDWIPGQRPKNRKLLSNIDRDELALEEECLPEFFQKAGYKTFFAGKWHLGDSLFFPENQGFDINLGGHHKGSPPGGYYSPYKNPKLSDGPEGEYLTDRLTDETINFISQSKNEPFFAVLSYYTVHTPIQACKEHLKYFEDKRRLLNIEGTKARAEGLGDSRLQQDNAAYASMVYAMDRNMGKIIKTLKEQGLYDNTTIVFTSDNGGLSTLQRRKDGTQRPGPTSVLPLRAGKGWLYEGGIRVPLIIKPAGSYWGEARSVDSPVVGHDIFPTLLSQNDLQYNFEGIDGMDLSPLLTGKEVSTARSLLWHYPHYHGSGWTPGAAFRKNNWKLIRFFEDEHMELYNLKEDLGEKNDLSKDYPDILEKLNAELEQELQKIHARMPRSNPKG